MLLIHGLAWLNLAITGAAAAAMENFTAWENRGKARELLNSSIHVQQMFLMPPAARLGTDPLSQTINVVPVYPLIVGQDADAVCENDLAILYSIATKLYRRSKN